MSKGEQSQMPRSWFLSPHSIGDNNPLFGHEEPVISFCNLYSPAYEATSLFRIQKCQMLASPAPLAGRWGKWTGLPAQHAQSWWQAVAITAQVPERLYFQTALCAQGQAVKGALKQSKCASAHGFLWQELGCSPRPCNFHSSAWVSWDAVSCQGLGNKASFCWISQSHWLLLALWIMTDKRTLHFLGKRNTPSYSKFYLFR
jgi:hypothetical protein